jgi:hypothetical protein
MRQASFFYASPAKAGAQSRAATWLSATLDHDNLPDWAPAFAGEAEVGK